MLKESHHMKERHAHHKTKKKDNKSSCHPEQMILEPSLAIVAAPVSDTLHAHSSSTYDMRGKEKLPTSATSNTTAQTTTAQLTVIPSETDSPKKARASTPHEELLLLLVVLNYAATP